MASIGLAPTIEQLRASLRSITRSRRLLTRQGALIGEQRQDRVSSIRTVRSGPKQAASCSFGIALGSQAGQKALSLQTISRRREQWTPALCANLHGFSLRAAVRLCRARYSANLSKERWDARARGYSADTRRLPAAVDFGIHLRGECAVLIIA